MTRRTGGRLRVVALAVAASMVGLLGLALPAAAVSDAEPDTARISGRITGDGGAGIDLATIHLCRVGECLNAYTAPTGEYVLEEIPAGTWKLGFSADGYQPQYWSDQGTQLMPVTITVRAGQVITGANGALIRGGTISGRVTGRDGEPVQGAYVYVESPIYEVQGEATADWHRTVLVDADGHYSVSGLPAASYHVEFMPPNDRLRTLQRTLWPGGTDPGAAATVSISGTQTVTGIDAVLIPPLSQVRVAGADRYATAVAVSQSRSAGEAASVFIVSGSDFPDALSAGPLAAIDEAPLLLTARDALPTVVREEIRRVKPHSITVVGGTGAVSAAVERELKLLVGGGSVTRLQGADRYVTSAEASRAGFPESHGGVVYVASGASYPDALSGAYLAGRDRTPLLLVTPTAVTDAVAAELCRLAPDRIVILGGPGAVSKAVETRLRTFSKEVVRLGGADRFATSVAASQYGFAPGAARVVYFAQGLDFPDALAAAPVAAGTGGPVLLTPRAGLGDALAREFLRLHSDRAVIIGGPGAVGQWICSSLETLGGPTYYDGDPPSPCGS